MCFALCQRNPLRRCFRGIAGSRIAEIQVRPGNHLVRFMNRFESDLVEGRKAAAVRNATLPDNFRIYHVAGVVHSLETVERLLCQVHQKHRGLHIVHATGGGAQQSAELIRTVDIAAAKIRRITGLQRRCEIHPDGSLNRQILRQRFRQITLVHGRRLRAHLPVEISGVNAGIRPVRSQNGAAFLPAFQHHAVFRMPGIRLLPDLLIHIALHQHIRHLLRIVFHIVQIMGEPTVQDIIVEHAVNQESLVLLRIRRGHVRALMQKQFHSLSCLHESVIHHLELLRGYIFVIQTVDNQRTAFQIRIPGIISFPPEFLIIIETALKLIHAELLVEMGDPLQIRLGGFRVMILAGAEIRQETHEHFLRPVTLGTLLIEETVPVCNACHRNDGLQSRHPGHRYRERHGARIGAARHGHIAVGPVRFRLDPAVRSGIRFPVAVEPFHYAAERMALQIGAGIFNSLGASGAVSCTEYNGKPPHQIVIIVVQHLVAHGVVISLVRIVPFRRVGLGSALQSSHLPLRHSWRRGILQGIHVKRRILVILYFLHMVITVCVDAGTIRTGFEDGSSPVSALRCAPGQLDKSFHQISLAVSVHIIVRLYVNAVADDLRGFRVIIRTGLPVCETEYRLGHPVFEHRLSASLIIHVAILLRCSIHITQTKNSIVIFLTVCKAGAAASGDSPGLPPLTRSPPASMMRQTTNR